MMRSVRPGASIAAVLIAGLAAAGCTADPVAVPPGPGVGPIGTTPVGAPGVQLVAFDSCESALREFKDAALRYVGPYGLPGQSGGDMRTQDGDLAAPNAAESGAESGADAKAPAQPQQHSTTNNHEAAADEPDLVKTDGKRIVSVLDDDELRVVDVASRRVTATVDLDGDNPTGLFLQGDKALVISQPEQRARPTERPMDDVSPVPSSEQLRLQLVDISGDGEIVEKLTVDGDYVDARATDGVARVVVRSGPRLQFSHPAAQHSEGATTERNREIIRGSSIEDWLPRYTNDGLVDEDSEQLVDCSRVSHPKPSTGASVLTVLTFDLAEDLGKGDPVSITAGGGTVYGTGENLYVADHGYEAIAMREIDAPTPVEPQPQRTKVYQFDTSSDGPPEFVASGAVHGSLLNQYSMSEHEGHLRMATTTRDVSRGDDQSSSAVVVLERQGDRLRQVGKVGGLGKGEQIYSMRFLGDLGYVVTFRQTDPLYRIDLSDPAEPRLDGELKITGYSSYLHPVGEDRLFGVGQEATTEGRITGMQASLFDIGDTKPARLDRLHLEGAHSEAEHDPHAFLYWPERDLVVLPVRVRGGGDVAIPEAQTSAALVLRVSGDSVERIGSVRHEVDDDSYRADIRRSLVIGDTLWTLSAAGVQANDLEDLGRTAYVRFD